MLKKMFAAGAALMILTTMAVASAKHPECGKVIGLDEDVTSSQMLAKMYGIHFTTATTTDKTAIKQAYDLLSSHSITGKLDIDLSKVKTASVTNWGSSGWNLGFFGQDDCYIGGIGGADKGLVDQFVPPPKVEPSGPEA